MVMDDDDDPADEEERFDFIEGDIVDGESGGELIPFVFEL